MMLKPAQTLLMVVYAGYSVKPVRNILSLGVLLSCTILDVFVKTDQGPVSQSLFLMTNDKNH